MQFSTTFLQFSSLLKKFLTENFFAVTAAQSCVKFAKGNIPTGKIPFFLQCVRLILYTIIRLLAFFPLTQSTLFIFVHCCVSCSVRYVLVFDRKKYDGNIKMIVTSCLTRKRNNFLTVVQICLDNNDVRISV